IKAFEEEYGRKAKPYSIDIIKESFEKLQREYSSVDFLMGGDPIILGRRRKAYGELMLAKNKGSLTIFSDCLDVSLIDYIKHSLIEGNTSVVPPEDATEQQNEIINDLNLMLTEITCKN
ncbi:MAG: hypothetical protein PHC84_06375, partial [Clostridia bacterium]|nr:hypothetical protein [Clostridia bacterium]